MNFLIHLYVTGDDPELLVGNLMGDFVKGRLTGQFPAAIEEGIILHRRIDSFAAGNTNFLRSKRRLDASCALYRGVLVDLFYDHFLALNWNEYASVPFIDFLSHATEIVRCHVDILPEKLRRMKSVIFGELLPSYLEIEGIERALGRMSTRLKRPNPLKGGAGELRKHYGGLYADFHQFMPELLDFVRGCSFATTEKCGIIHLGECSRNQNESIG